MAGNKNSGRTKLPEKEKAGKAISVWLRPAEKKMIVAASKAAHDPAGRWLGKLGLREAKNVLSAMGIDPEKL